MDRKVVNIILEMKENNKYIPGLRAYTGFKQKGLEIEREKRYYGKTRVGNTRLILRQCKLQILMVRLKR